MSYVLNTPADQKEMLERIGAGFLEELFRSIPADLRLKRPLEVPPALTEMELQQHLGELARANPKVSGTRTMANGLAWSINEVAAYIMKQFGPEGPKRFAEFIHQLNIPTAVEPYPSLALGACELSLYEMMWGYTVFPSGGISTQPYYISRIEDKHGNVLARFPPDHKEVLSHATAYTMLKRAADAGHVDATYRTGLYLMDGIGTRKDTRAAYAAFQSAASRGHLYATIMAWDMLNNGNGVRQDWDEAYRLSRVVAAQGEAYGAVMAASSLLQGRNPKDHEDEVLYWIDVALRDGDNNIRNTVGPMREKIVAAFRKAHAPPQYAPRVFRACPMKTTCLVDHYTGLQKCTTNKDYWNDCDG